MHIATKIEEDYMANYKIPFNKPFLAGKELYYIAQAVLSGHTAGDGMFTKKCQALMQEKFGANKILLTHSCTAAMEMAAVLCDIGQGDDVIFGITAIAGVRVDGIAIGDEQILIDALEGGRNPGA